MKTRGNDYVIILSILSKININATRSIAKPEIKLSILSKINAAIGADLAISIGLTFNSIQDQHDLLELLKAVKQPFNSIQDQLMRKYYLNRIGIN